MKINAKNLKQQMAKAGVSRDQLGQAISRPGLRGQKAVAAIGHWLNSRDLPRATAADVEKLTQTLGCPKGELVEYVSVSRFIRSSPRKVKLVTDLILGKTADRALTELSFSKRRAAVMVTKALKAAIASADQAEADTRSLVVKEARVDAGPVMKRFQPKDRGRAHAILKRMSHIRVVVEER